LVFFGSFYSFPIGKLPHADSKLQKGHSRIFSKKSLLFAVLEDLRSPYARAKLAVSGVGMATSGDRFVDRVTPGCSCCDAVIRRSNLVAAPFSARASADGGSIAARGHCRRAKEPEPVN
jgi:hypothetical protein